MYIKLKRQLTALAKVERSKFIISLAELKEVNEALSMWWVRQYLTPAKIKKGFENLNQLREAVLTQYDKKKAKQMEAKFSQLDAIFNCKPFKTIEIEIEYIKSKTWGYNPKPTICAWDGDNYERFELSSVTGCGFDKQSQAVANALNMIDGLKKTLYDKKEKKPKANNKELFGYGSGYGIIPYIEGGVGVECYKQIFKSIGYKFEQTANGKNYDKFIITKK